MVTKLSSSGEEEYPKGEVVAKNKRLKMNILYSLPPRPKGHPSSRGGGEFK